MSNTAAAADPAGAKFGPYRLMPGVSGVHAATWFYAAMFNIAMMSFINLMHPQLFEHVLGVPDAVQGRLAGSLSTFQEAIVICLTGLAGAAGDKLGRRPVYVTGFLVLALCYFLYPLAGSPAGLFAVRALFAVGIVCTTTMLLTLTGDYSHESTRGRWVGTMGFLNGLGVLLASTLLVRLLPAQLTEMTGDPALATRWTLWVGTGVCLISALVMRLGLRGGVPIKITQRESIWQILGQGLAAARDDKRIGLACLASLAARGDVVVAGTFLFMWTSRFAEDSGLSIDDGTARGALLFPVVALTVLLWTPIFGFLILDRLNRVTGVIVAFTLSTAGYLWFGLSPDPFANQIIAAAVLMGLGEGSAIISSVTLMGKVTPPAVRGAAFGLFSTAAAVGIMLCAFVGGILFDQWRYGGPFIFVAGINALVVIAGLWVRRNTPA